MGHVRVNGGNSGVNGLSQKGIKLFYDRKDSFILIRKFFCVLYVVRVPLKNLIIILIMT